MVVSPTAVALCHAWLHGHILVPQWFCPCGQCYHQKVFKNNHMAVPVKVVRQQTPPKPSETLELSAGANRNPPEPSELASGTYTSTHRNPLEPSGTCLRNLHHHTRDFPEPSGTCLRSLHQHTPEPSGTFRNLPPEPTPAHAGTMRKLHQHSGTFQNLPPEPTPAHTGTLRNLPEPSHTPEPSGTFRNLPPEPAPATRTGTHRSLSGLKTPLAYAVGEKTDVLTSDDFWASQLAVPTSSNFACGFGRRGCAASLERLFLSIQKLSTFDCLWVTFEAVGFLFFSYFIICSSTFNSIAVVFCVSSPSCWEMTRLHPSMFKRFIP